MNFQYDKMTRLVEQNDFSMLNPVHINLSGFKALFTTQTFEDIKILRECCGAAGFIRFGGFWKLHDTAAPNVTLEGDSIVMSLQTARALLKTGRKALVKDKKISKTLGYIEDLKRIKEFDFTTTTPDFFDKEENLLELIKVNALLSIYNCSMLFNKDDRHKESLWEKFNQKYQLEIVKMTRDHTYFMAALYFWNGASKLPFSMDRQAKEHCRTLFKIWAQNTLVQHCNELIEASVITPEQLNIIHENHLQDVRLLRPQFLPIVESAQISDD